MTPIRSLLYFCFLVALAAIVYAGWTGARWPMLLAATMVVFGGIFVIAEMLGPSGPDDDGPGAA